MTELVAYKPDQRATRTSVKNMVVRWFTIEPVLSDRFETSRMTANINSINTKIIAAAAGAVPRLVEERRAIPGNSGEPQLICEVDVRLT